MPSAPSWKENARAASRACPGVRGQHDPEHGIGGHRGRQFGQSDGRDLTHFASVSQVAAAPPSSSISPPCDASAGRSSRPWQTSTADGSTRWARVGASRAPRRRRRFAAVPRSISSRSRSAAPARVRRALCPRRPPAPVRREAARDEPRGRRPARSPSRARRGHRASASPSPSPSDPRGAPTLAEGPSAVSGCCAPHGRAGCGSARGFRNGESHAPSVAASGAPAHHADLWCHLLDDEVVEVSADVHGEPVDDDIATVTARTARGTLVAATFAQGTRTPTRSSWPATAPRCE